MSLGDVVIDVECYPNFFCCGFRPVTAPEGVGYIFEISDRRNDTGDLYAFIIQCDRMVGFNNMAYDWPMLDHFISLLAEQPYITAADMWAKNEVIAESGFANRWDHVIWRPTIPQIDLFMIHHLDRFTVGLKQIEMTMRSRSVKDLPFPIGTRLTHEQMDIVLRYNAHDINETLKFHNKSKKDIEFRESLGPEWINYNNGKIGVKFFERELEKAGVKLYEDTRYGERRRKRQTPRPLGIHLGKVILPLVRFTRPYLQEQLEYIKEQVIPQEKTKGGFATVVKLDGFDIDVKLGGIHGSVKSVVVRHDVGRVRDFDVTSYYPSVAIEHLIYPAHLGPIFCEVYRHLRDWRTSLSKTDRMRTTLKYANNVPFGQSNEKNSIFFDPAYMLAITMNGQLMLCMLAEQFANAGVRVIQVNTDGVTIQEKPGQEDIVDSIVRWWQGYTKMPVEEKQYRRMFIKDSTNYIAEHMNGEIKRIGVYDWTKTHNDKFWVANHSELAVPKAAEMAMLHDIDPLDYLKTADPWDFLLFVKGKLELSDGSPLPRNLRYYVSETGQGLVSIYSPLAGKSEPRRIGIHAEGLAEPIGKRKDYACSICGEPFNTKEAFSVHNKRFHSWKITPAMDFDGRRPVDLDLRYYLQEARKIIID